jgi:hypothetical protein
MFNKLEARVLSEYKRSRAAPSTFCTLIKHYFSFIKHYINIILGELLVKAFRVYFVLRRNMFCKTQLVLYISIKFKL